MDWIASLLEILGKWVIGNKNKNGFIVASICCLCWIYVAIDKEVYGLFIAIIPALFINIRNYLKWRRDENNNR